jgi:hypothetical protein
MAADHQPPGTPNEGPGQSPKRMGYDFLLAHPAGPVSRGKATDFLLLSLAPGTVDVAQLSRVPVKPAGEAPPQVNLSFSLMRMRLCDNNGEPADGGAIGSRSGQHAEPGRKGVRMPRAEGTTARLFSGLRLVPKSAWDEPGRRRCGY